MTKRVLSEQDKRAALAVIDETDHFRTEIQDRYGGTPSTDAVELLHELQEERTRQLD